MLTALFKQAAEGIIISSKEGIIKMANPAAEAQFGYEPSELIGLSIEVLVPMRSSRLHAEKREGYIHNPHSRKMGAGLDLFARKKDGSEFPVEISLSTFETSEGMFVMSFIVDITERKKKDAELASVHSEIKKLNLELEKRVDERTEELARAVKELAESKQEITGMLTREQELNELKSRFITTASHEFRTPLATILSSVSLISKYEAPQDSEKRAKHIARIKSSVSNLTGILNDFLSLSKLEEGLVRNNPIPFELTEFIKELTDEMRNMSKPGQKIQYNHLGESTEVSLDKQLLKNVMINLLSNAIKYSDEGKMIECISEHKGNNIVLTVKDEGLGISMEDQPHVFERFFRAKNAVNIEGTGLGLNIIKKYVELMQGEINFESELNKGSSFSVIIPNSVENE